LFCGKQKRNETSFSTTTVGRDVPEINDNDKHDRKESESLSELSGRTVADTQVCGMCAKEKRRGEKRMGEKRKRGEDTGMGPAPSPTQNL